MRDFLTSDDDWIRFGPGAEAEAASLLTRLGAERVLLVCQERYRGGADRVAEALGDRAAGVFSGVTVQVPEDVAQAAVDATRQAEADWVVAHGGGSAVGVAKAVALRCDVSVGAVPTTYAGSERTRIYGLMQGGHKVTGRDDRVRPRLVVYDPELTRGLPRVLSLKSILNALAHSIEALYAVQATDRARQAARDSLAPLLDGFTGIDADPSDLEARAEATYGAYLAAEALDGASMALHHKLAHVLGGSFGTPHADTHAILLPYTLAFNAPAAPEAVAALSQAWSTDAPAGHLHGVMTAAGLPTSLRTLGLDEAAISRAAELAARKAYPNPRPLDRDGFHAVLSAALSGAAPV